MGESMPLLRRMEARQHILHNETSTANHWLTISLMGHKSNRDGIGAEIEVTGSKFKQLVTVSTAGGYLSSKDKRAHFGLGADAVVKQVEVRWPSGKVQKLQDVKSDQVLKVEEPE